MNWMEPLFDILDKSGLDDATCGITERRTVRIARISCFRYLSTSSNNEEPLLIRN
jgi:hypothetical protein